MIYIYKIALILLSIALSPIIAIAFAVKPKFRAGFREKLGLIIKKPDKKSILLHAVSVGEINATEGLIKRIKEEFPEYNLVVTTVTATGQEVANNKLKNTADIITYFPYDFCFSVKAALEAYNPALIVIAETEIWPNFVDIANKKEIPVMLVNGRISPSSYKGYKNFRFFFENILNKFSLILMQTNSDKERIVKIGAPKEKTEVMGNLKFDIKKNLEESSMQELKNSLKVGENKVLIAGSTHQGEDKIVLNVYKRLRLDFTDLKLLLAPRHPERNENVEELIKAEGLKYGRRSQKQDFDAADVILLDTMGELGQLYAVSHLAFVGGSFSGTGGHNPLEPAIYGIPVISGNIVYNFKDIYKIMSETEAAKLVDSEEALYLQLKDYLVNDEKYLQASRACCEIFEKNRGALDFAIQQMKKFL